MVLNKLKKQLFGRKLVPAEVRSVLASEEFQPIFFLSTGRCGTRWFTEVLKQHENIDVHHNTAPELYEQSLMAYQLLKQGKADGYEVQRLLEEMVYCARQEIMADSLRKGHRYIETNNRITFFTPQLARIFPHAKFVHLYRDPAGFVKSGMNREWYNGSRFDHVRPKLDAAEWDARSRVWKIAWLWRETNVLIDRFLANLPEARYRRYDFTALDSGSVAQLLIWLGIDPEERKIAKMIDTPVNVQKSGSFPRYEDWSASDRADLLDACGEYAAELGFEYKP